MKAYDLSKLEVIIAEENEDMRAVLREVMGAFGVEDMRICANGKEVVDAIKKRPADLVFTAWNMKPVDGITLVKWLRQDKASPARNVPIVMITARTDRNDVVKAREAGVTAYLAKPVTPERIYQRIADIVERAKKTKSKTGGSVRGASAA